jgi:hypothetical protein
LLRWNGSIRIDRAFAFAWESSCAARYSRVDWERIGKEEREREEKRGIREEVREIQRERERERERERAREREREKE